MPHGILNFGIFQIDIYRLRERFSRAVSPVTSDASDSGQLIDPEESWFLTLTGKRTEY